MWRGDPRELLPVPGIHFISTEALYSVFVSHETKAQEQSPWVLPPEAK